MSQAPQSLKYQGGIIHLIDETLMSKIAGKPIRYRYGIETNEGIKIKVVAHDFGNGVDWNAIEEMYKEAPLVELKVKQVVNRPPRKRQAYKSKSDKPRRSYKRMDGLSEDEKQAIYEARRQAHNARQRELSARKRALLPPKEAKPIKEKVVKVKKEAVPKEPRSRTYRKPDASQAFSLGGKEKPRDNAPKVDTKAAVQARKAKVISPALADYLAQLEAEKQAARDWNDSQASILFRLAGVEKL